MPKCLRVVSIHTYVIYQYTEHWLKVYVLVYCRDFDLSPRKKVVCKDIGGLSSLQRNSCRWVIYVEFVFTWDFCRLVLYTVNPLTKQTSGVEDVFGKRILLQMEDDQTYVLKFQNLR